ncbi:recombinase family protein [Sinorhizobium fredii]|uniref:recombinase family protein n=1 Tax=Rhizobium fredii TaxID=380 RepID=UPI001295DB58|nr:recombinase family protein [Sinorhizobium fredii]MQW94112.1 recombinase family protein [Sinorhizobium fredii]
MRRRAVGYSRFSTDLQNEKSIADQEALIRRYAQQHDYEIIKLYSDAAQSGASTLNRDGLLDLLEDAKDGKFDAVIVEELDRLSRDMEDLAGIHKRLSFKNIEIIAIHEGVASTVTVGLRGLVGQLFREDNARKVRRGLQGKVRAGLSAGGKAYGYRPDPLNKGKLIIVKEEADIVRRIFEEFAEGSSPRAIAHRLAAENVPPPRGCVWSGNAIYGWAERGSGILRNRLYAGEIVWNKIRMVKDPDTGKRISRANPPEEWQRHKVPELQIVDRELFERVQVMIKPKERDHAERVRMRRPQRLLSGLLRCGACGGGMSAKGTDKSGRTRIECSRQRDSGTCPDPQTFYLDKVEEIAFQLLRKELEHPELLVEFVQQYNQARMEYAHKMIERRATLEARVKTLDQELTRLVSYIAKGIGDADRIGEEIMAREAEFKAAKEELSREPEPISPVMLHPASIAAYRNALYELQAAVRDRTNAGYPKLVECLREVIHDVIIRRGPEKGQIDVTLRGKLRVLLSQPLKKRVGGTVVAEEGFEPPTQGL